MKKIITILFVLLLVGAVGAQNTQVPRTLRTGARNANNARQTERNVKFFLGGNINSNFGSKFALGLEGGAYATRWLRFGVGPRYEMTYDYGNDKVLHSAGATAFAEAIIANYLIGHVGYEFLNYPTFAQDANGFYDYSTPIRRNIHALALGIGFQTRLTEIVGLYAQYVIYPVQSKNDYYNKFLPMFARLGVTVDL